jgi:hypothetical protein
VFFLLVIVTTTFGLVVDSFNLGNLADSNNKNLGNTLAEIQRNQKLVDNNNQDYAKVGCLSHGWFHALGWLLNLWCC